MEASPAAAPRETIDFTIHPLIAQVDIRNILAGDLVEGDVPLQIICTEDVPVETENVIDISASLEKERKKKHSKYGQQLPVLLAEVIDEPIEELLIIDGFHRTTSLKDAQAETIDSRVRLNSTMDEVIAQRIENAAKHRALRFARLVEWIDTAWQRTDWADQLTPLQAFSFAQANKGPSQSGGRRLGLSPAEARELKAWVGEKCKQWDLTASSICSTLTIAANADPTLVKEVRERRGRHTELEALSAQHLGVIAAAYPGNFEMQRHCANVVLANNLSVPLTRGLMKLFEVADDPEETYPILEDPKFIKLVKPIKATTRAKKTPPPKASTTPAAPPTSHIAGLHDRSFKMPSFEELAELYVESEVKLARLALENIVLRRRYIPNPLVPTAAVPSYELSVSDTIPVEQPWKDDRVNAAVAHLEQVRKGVVANVTKTQSIPAAVALGIVGNAEKRIINDTRDGALRFTELDDIKAVDLILGSAVRDEIVRYRRTKGSAVQPENSQPATPRPRQKTLSLLKSLPKLEGDQRKLLVLNGLLKLSPHIVAQVLSYREEHIAAAINSIATGL